MTVEATIVAGDEAAAASAAAAVAAKATTDAAAKATADAAALAATQAGKTPEQIAAEKKTADDAAAAKAATDEAALKAKGKDGITPKAPDKYALTVPDEAKTRFSDVLSEFTDDVEAVARANDWTNEEAQAELVARLTLAATRNAAMSTRFRAETEADPDYGGANLDQSMQFARKAIDVALPPGHKYREGFLRLLNGSGYGNKVEVVAALANLGKLHSEDRTTGGTGARAGVRKSDADLLFGDVAGVKKE